MPRLFHASLKACVERERLVDTGQRLSADANPAARATVVVGVKIVALSAMRLS